MAIVYVLTNTAMPGLVKIGETSHDAPDTRVSQLYTTGVPVPFDIEFACEVDNYEQVEKALHVAFGPQRVNPKREFFEIEPTQAIEILKLLDRGRDVTEAIRSDRGDIDASDTQAADRLRKRRPNLNFTEMGVPRGSVLLCTVDQSTAIVMSDRTVDYGGQEMSLTKATATAKGIDYALAPTPYWTFEGRPLREIYEDTYSSRD